jgi:antirestriction protein
MKNSISTLNEAKVYVGTYAKYNSGSIKGEWLTLSDYSDRDEFLKACAELHNDETDPELMFQDTDGLPDVFYSESSIDESFWTLLEATKDFDSDRLTAFFEYASNRGETPSEDLISSFEEDFQGNYKDEEEYAYEVIEQCYDLEKTMGNLACYFDYEKFARDLFISDYWMSETGNVFRNS